MKQNNKDVKLMEKSKDEIISSNHINDASQKDKKMSEWVRTMNLLFSYKRYVLTLLPIILIAIFLGSICSSLQKNGYTLYLFFCLSGVILLFVLSFFLIYKTKRIIKSNNMSLNVYLGIILIYIFISGFTLMIFFKILSIVNSSNIFNLTGLISVVVVVTYLMLLISIVIIDFGKIRCIFKKRIK